MDIAKKKRDGRLIPVSLRLPAHIREMAKQAAKDSSAGDVTVKEAEVYREIIENFFSSAATDCSHNRRGKRATQERVSP